MGAGIPGLRVGVTVPDIEQAHAFFVGVLGCDYAYSLPEMRHGDDWMLDHLNVDPRAVVREIRFYRCGHGLNFEVFESTSPCRTSARSRATVTSAATTLRSTSTIWMRRSATCGRKASSC